MSTIAHVEPREMTECPLLRRESDEITAMTISVQEMMKDVTPERRRRIQQRTEQLVAEELTLRQLREARQLTQVNVAAALGISQEGVSRLERRSDLLLSTLRRTIEAMGGSLSLTATFPDRPPAELAGLSDADTES